MDHLVAIPIQDDPVCACGHGRSVHRADAGICAACRDWGGATPWRAEMCLGFADSAELVRRQVARLVH